MSFLYRFAFLSSIVVLLLYIFIASVDPYDKLSYNFWGIKEKAISSIRERRFYTLENSKEIYDIFLLGSSNIHNYDISLIKKRYRLNTFNYGVFNAKPEDLLAITNHIISRQKPKILWLNLDFYMLNASLPYDKRFVKSPLYDYFDSKYRKEINIGNSFFYDGYFTTKALYDSIKLLYIDKMNIKKTHSEKEKIQIDSKRNACKITIARKIIKYSYKNYHFDSKRIEYLRKLRELCIEHKIKLIVTISPISKEHFCIIESSRTLFEKYLKFKEILVDIFGSIYDFGNLSVIRIDDCLWQDSVHPGRSLSNIIVDRILGREKPIYGEDFGIAIDKTSTKEYIELLKAKSLKYCSELKIDET